MPRKPIPGRNINDSDADLYAEYQEQFKRYSMGGGGGLHAYHSQGSLDATPPGLSPLNPTGHMGAPPPVVPHTPSPMVPMTPPHRGSQESLTGSVYPIPSATPVGQQQFYVQPSPGGSSGSTPPVGQQYNNPAGYAGVSPQSGGHYPHPSGSTPPSASHNLGLRAGSITPPQTYTSSSLHYPRTSPTAHTHQTTHPSPPTEQKSDRASYQTHSRHKSADWSFNDSIPDLSGTIETDFTSLYSQSSQQSVQQGQQQGSISSSQRSLSTTPGQQSQESLQSPVQSQLGQSSLPVTTASQTSVPISTANQSTAEQSHNAPNVVSQSSQSTGNNQNPVTSTECVLTDPMSPSQSSGYDFSKFSAVYAEHEVMMREKQEYLRRRKLSSTPSAHQVWAQISMFRFKISAKK